MINVLINGCNGRMGKEVAKVVQEQEDMTVIAGFDRTESDNGYFTVFADFAKLPVDKIDVIIDFSVPEATFAMLSFAKKHHIPMVIATTGFSQEERTQIQKEAKELPIFQSANMSFDINLMGKIVAELAKNLPDTDVEIIEAHHNHIKTESKIAEIVKNAECFKFVTVEGSLIWLHELGLRQINYDEAREKVIKKMEQKRLLLTLEDCKQEAETNCKKIYELFK